MTALMSLLTPLPGEEGETFAIIADDQAARYVFEGGADTDEVGLDSARIDRLANWAEKRPTSADGWLALAAQGVGYAIISDPREFESLEEALERAVELIAAQPASYANPHRAPGQPDESAPPPPLTRADVMAAQREAMDAWAQQYPEAAAGDVHDPEADLALMHLMTPPVDPTQPHRWLPIATTETDCGFCERPAEDAIHAAEADTVTTEDN